MGVDGGASFALIAATLASTTASIAMQKKPPTPQIPKMPDLPKAPDLSALDAQSSAQRAAALGTSSTVLTGPQGLGSSPGGKSVLGS